MADDSPGTVSDFRTRPLPVQEIRSRFIAAWQAGQTPRIEAYVGQTPEPDYSTILKELLALDLAYRQQNGPAPTLEEYCQRFPRHVELVRALFAVTRTPPRDGLGSPQDGETVGFAERSANQSVTRPLPPGISGPQQSQLSLDGYEILRLLPGGGMGVVYQARQLNPDRLVALKVLPPGLANDPERLQRFRNEAALAAGLNNCHILPIYAVLEAGGAPVLVMPFVEYDLGRLIADRRAVRSGEPAAGRHPWAALSDQEYLAKVVSVLDRIVDSAVALTQAGVLHRDIKPSNILLDSKNNVWLSDFGLARLAEGSGTTMPGVGLGTPGYMSPEQWEGQTDIDPRTDQFSLAATIYQMLTLELPYGKKRIRVDTPAPPAPSKLQRALPAGFDVVLQTALRTDRKERYPTIVEFWEDWQRVRRGLPPRVVPLGRVRRWARQAWRFRWQAASLLIVALAASLLSVYLSRESAPKRDVSIRSEPEGAKVALVPLDEFGQRQLDHILRSGRPTPATFKDVPCGEYLVVVKLSQERFHEVFRLVPRHGQVKPGAAAHQNWEEAAGGVVQLPVVHIPPATATDDMTRFEGGKFTMGSLKLSARATPHERQVDAFWLETKEVTVGAFRDRTGSLPTALRFQRKAPDDADPVTELSYDEALSYAELAGRRLPDEAEFEFASTSGGKLRFPWGDDWVKTGPWEFGPAGEPAFDRTKTVKPVFGLFSNVVEWTTTGWYAYPTMEEADRKLFYSPEKRAMGPGLRVIRGGPAELLQRPTNLAPGPQAWWDPRNRFFLNRNSTYPGLGFRCARSFNCPYVDR